MSRFQTDNKNLAFIKNRNKRPRKVHILLTGDSNDQFKADFCSYDRYASNKLVLKIRKRRWGKFTSRSTKLLNYKNQTISRVTRKQTDRKQFFLYVFGPKTYQKVNMQYI